MCIARRNKSWTGHAPLAASEEAKRRGGHESEGRRKGESEREKMDKEEGQGE